MKKSTVIAAAVVGGAAVGATILWKRRSKNQTEALSPQSAETASKETVSTSTEKKKTSYGTMRSALFRLLEKHNIRIRAVERFQPTESVVEPTGLRYHSKGRLVAGLDRPGRLFLSIPLLLSGCTDGELYHDRAHWIVVVHELSDNTESPFIFYGRIEPFSMHDLFGEDLVTISKLDDLLSGRVVSYGLPSEEGNGNKNKDWIKIQLDKSVA